MPDNNARPLLPRSENTPPLDLTSMPCRRPRLQAPRESEAKLLKVFSCGNFPGRGVYFRLTVASPEVSNERSRTKCHQLAPKGPRRVF